MNKEIDLNQLLPLLNQMGVDSSTLSKDKLNKLVQVCEKYANEPNITPDMLNSISNTLGVKSNIN